MKKDDFEGSLQTPLICWGQMDKKEVFALLGIEAARMVGYEQRNPHHCYDLFMHTLHTVDKLVSQPSVLLRTAAFLHDIGKPSVAMEKDGRLVFYSHAKKSAEIAEPILEKLGYTDDEIHLICFYIRHHDDFISWVLPEDDYDHENPYLVEINDQNLRNHIDKVVSQKELPKREYTRKLWSNLLLLCRADASSQAERVLMNGRQVDSKERKLKKLDRIISLL